MVSDKDDTALETLFDAGRARPARPSTDFLARLRADVDDALHEPVRRAPARPRLMSRLGGFFVASGLSGAAALGVWIGFAMPELLNLDLFVTATEDVGLYAFLPGADLTALRE